MKTSPDHSNFTLIELLVVVAIIGILSSLIVPALESAREAGRTALCASNQRQLQVAIVLYTDDWDRVFPYNDPGPPWLGWMHRVGQISPGEYKGSGPGIDPNRDTQAAGYIPWNRRDNDAGVFKCPTAIRRVQPVSTHIEQCYHHYGMNSTLTDLAKPRRYSAIEGPMVVLGDSHIARNPGQPFYFWKTITRNGWDKIDRGYYPWPLQSVVSIWKTPLEPVNFVGHPGGAQLAYADGSVQRMSRERIDAPATLQEWNWP